MNEHLKYIDYLKGATDSIRSLTDQLPVGIYRTSVKGKILYANPALAKMLGYTIDELYELSVNDLYFVSDERDQEVKTLIKDPKEKNTKEIRLKTKNGKIIFVKDTVNVIRDENNKIQYFDGVLEDITAQKEAEKEILKLSTAIKQSPASVVITDLDGNIEYVNPKFCELTGYSFEEAIGKNPNILKSEHTKSEDYKEMWETISQGNTWKGEFLNKKKDGSIYWEIASISPIIDDSGNIIKYIAVKEDITERKNTEQALIKSEKELLESNATKNMFFSIIAHDLKGPIGSFLQLLNLLKTNFNDISNDEKLDYVNILIGLSNKTNNLLEDLLLWARIQMHTMDLEIDTFSVESIIKQSITIVEEKAQEKNITIETQIDPLIRAKANADSVKTIVRNLLSNAIKFSFKNSIVKIKSELDLNNNNVNVSIIDQGVGIPSEMIDKLFKIETTFSTYGTEKEKGTGLGLILCKDLITKNKGNIWVESEEKQGSMFTISLPLA
jgi:PAS domain S-box-containing protein